MKMYDFPMKKDNWISANVENRETKDKERGMFAIQPIQAGEVVVSFGGEYTTDPNEAEAARLAGKLIMQWDATLWSIEDRGDGEDYFLNHSCDSSLWMQDAYTLIAKRDILTDEELTADYALWEADETFIAKWECRCGSLGCRKKITGKDWRLRELQERYRNHFSPLLNKRITNIRHMRDNSASV